MNVRDRLRQRIFLLAAILGGVLLYGTAGYRWLGAGQSSWVDCLYMTVITITTIGFGEVVQGMETAAGRLFTITLAFLGVGIFTYTVSTITFFATDEELRARWRRRRMENDIRNWTGHYLIGGWGRTAEQISDELRATSRKHLVLAPAAAPPPMPARQADRLMLEGDPCDEEVLRRAGIERAVGYFAVSDDDSANIVACLTARHLHPGLRIVAMVADPRNADKMRKAGADAVISSTSIGALRMTSEMVRPTVVSFLDTMLRSSEPTLRVEEVVPASRHAGTPLGKLMKAGDGALLVALRRADGWQFNPAPDRVLAAGETLIVMTPPAAHQALCRDLCEP